nr:uncharacterized protein LOC113816558 [Penaeus vannamei]
MKKDKRNEDRARGARRSDRHLVASPLSECAPAARPTPAPPCHRWNSAPAPGAARPSQPAATLPWRRAQETQRRWRRPRPPALSPGGRPPSSGHTGASTPPLEALEAARNTATTPLDAPARDSPPLLSQDPARDTHVPGSGGGGDRGWTRWWESGGQHPVAEVTKMEVTRPEDKLCAAPDRPASPAEAKLKPRPRCDTTTVSALTYSLTPITHPHSPPSLAAQFIENIP